MVPVSLDQDVEICDKDKLQLEEETDEKNKKKKKKTNAEPVRFGWVKGVMVRSTVKKKLLTNREASSIFLNQNISNTFCLFSLFRSGAC